MQESLGRERFIIKSRREVSHVLAPWKISSIRVSPTHMNIYRSLLSVQPHLLGTLSPSDCKTDGSEQVINERHCLLALAFDSTRHGYDLPVTLGSEGSHQPE